MTVEFITKEELHLFKKELLKEFHKQPQKNNKWLKSSDVRKMLNVSPNTLQRMRINGSLNFSKVGGTFFYKNNDILRMLEGRKIK